MNVQIVLFAGLRQAAGFKQRTLALPEGATVGELLANLAEEGADWLQRTFYIAVNQEYAGRDTVLHEGDEVAFLPPVSGGRAPVAIRVDPPKQRRPGSVSSRCGP